jgi:hypothetical protein
MPANLADLTTRVQQLIGNDTLLSAAEVYNLAQTRYEHLYETFHFSRRHRDFTISLFAQVSSNNSTLVTVTNGNSTVTSAGSPFTTSVATTARQIQIGSEEQYFFVNSRTNDSAIVLGDGEATAVNWAGANASNQSWRLFQTIYTLPTTAGPVISLAWDTPIEELDGGRAALDEIDPDRSSTDATPKFWCYAGVNSTSVREIEVWPVPTTAKVLRGQFLREAPTLAANTTIDIPYPPLVYYTAADGCHLLHAKQGSTESMWENKALFFERKGREVMADYMPIEDDLTSPARSLRRASSNPLRSLRGTDYETSHDLDLL